MIASPRTARVASLAGLVWLTGCLESGFALLGDDEGLPPTGLPDNRDEQDDDTDDPGDDDGSNDGQGGADGTDDTGELPPEPGFAGRTTFTWASHGDLVCDADLLWRGAPYPGDCPECLFQFGIETTVQANRSTADCVLGSHPSYTLVYPDPDVTMVVGWAQEYGSRRDTLLVGYGLPELGYPGPYWLGNLGHRGSPNPPTLSDSGALTWDLARTDYDTERVRGPFRDDCGDLEESTALGEFPSPTDLAGSLPCDATDGRESSAVDRYEVLATGGRLTVMVDTVDSATAGDLSVLLNTPDGCSVVAADNNFACSHAPTVGDCPSFSAELEPGVYTLYVKHRNRCTSSRVDYVLSVGGRVESATLLDDDLARFRYSPWALTSDGSATAVWEESGASGD